MKGGKEGWSWTKKASRSSLLKVVREFGRATARREVVQRAVECVVESVSHFNGDDVPYYMQAYNEEMNARDVDEALRLEFFCRVVAP